MLVFDIWLFAQSVWMEIRLTHVSVMCAISLVFAIKSPALIFQLKCKIQSKCIILLS